LTYSQNLKIWSGVWFGAKKLLGKKLDGLAQKV